MNTGYQGILQFRGKWRDYQERVLDASKPIVCVESSSDNIWYKYASSKDYVINLTQFGKSGKADEVLDYFNLSEEKLTKRILSLLKSKQVKNCLQKQQDKIF